MWLCISVSKVIHYAIFQTFFLCDPVTECSCYDFISFGIVEIVIWLA